MRKRNVSYLIDKLFWILIAVLPLIVWLIVIARIGQLTSLVDVMTSTHLLPLMNNSIFTTLSDIFGSTGVVPLIQNPDILLYMSYFIGVTLIHLLVDFVLFIPRIAMNWLDNLYKLGGSND